MDAKKLAENIADKLFTNGNGDNALRLELKSLDHKYLGGWCKQAVIDVIAQALEQAGAK
jgi:hypothetical protein